MVSPVTSDRPVAPAMPETHRLVARIRSLAALRATLILGGRALLVASAIAVVAVLLGKYFTWPWARSILVAWPILTALSLLALFAGIVLGLLRTPRPLAAASMADRFVGPSDHLRAALELSRRTPQDPFFGILLADAERAARACPPAKVVPMRFGRAWPVAALLLGAAVCSVIWVPMRTIDPSRLARDPDPTAPALASQVARVAQEVRAASESIGPAISPRDAERLAELERELLDGSIRTDDARAEAAASAASLAERAEREAEQNRLAADRLKDLASAASERAAANPAPDDPSADATAPAPGFDPSEAAEAGTLSNPEPESSPTRSMPDPNVNELMNALSEGDLARAAEAARQLSEQAESLSLEERARIAEQLDALAEAMDQQLPPPEPSSSEATPPAASKPPPSDPSPSPSSAPSPTQPPSQPAAPPPAPAPAQPQSAPPPGTATEPSEAPEDPIEAQADAQESAARDRAESIKQEAQRSAERDARSIADAARDAADEMRRPPPPPAPSDQAQDTPQDRPGEQQPRSEQQQDVEQRGAEPQETGQEQQGDQQRQGSGEQGAEQQGSEEQGAEGQQTGKEQQGGEQQRGSDQQGTKQQQGSEQQQGARQEQGSEQQQGAQQQQGTEQQQSGEPQPGSEQQGSEQRDGSDQQGPEQQGSEPQGSQQQPGAQPRPGSGLERLQRTLREASERNADARRQQQAAERLRELSEDLAAGPETTPEPGLQPAPDQREGDTGIRREPDADDPFGGSGPPESPLTPGPRPSLDRPRTSGEAPTSIENVQGPKPSTPIGAGRAGGERPSDRPAPTQIAPITPSTLREAASGVERAIEQQSVPDRRSDLVRRVFQRYRDRAESTSPVSTTPPDRP